MLGADQMVFLVVLGRGRGITVSRPIDAKVVVEVQGWVDEMTVSQNDGSKALCNAVGYESESVDGLGSARQDRLVVACRH